MHDPLSDNGHQQHWDPALKLVSKTDPKGIITFVNDAFVEVSGYSREELLGQNHNLVRHKDMPADAFTDLWQEVQAGRPWNGRVKNRCKNGDHYWVDANVTPIFRGGEIVEYMSVRTAPSAEQITEAELAYERMGRGQRPGGSLLSAVTTCAYNRLDIVLFAAFGGLQLGLVSANTQSATGQGLTLAISLLGAYALLLWPTRRRLAKTTQLLRQIGEGNFDLDIDFRRPGAWGSLMQAVQCMKLKMGFDLQTAKLHLAEGQRLRRGLDVCHTNVMLADKSNNIIYVNNALKDMFSNAEADFREALPDFRANRLLGSNMDQFHRHPEHQREVVAKLHSAHKVEVQIGGRSIRILTTPVLNKAGERLGSVVEWLDRTEELALEQEFEECVGKAVEAAALGDFSSRIDVVGKNGMVLALSERLNLLLATTGQAMNDIMNLLSGLARGDLCQRIDGDYQGEFARMRDDANRSIQLLSDVVQSIRGGARHVADTSSEIATANQTLSRTTEQQASSLEELAAAMEEMTSNVRQTAENVGNADSLVDDAKQRAQHSDSVSAEAVTAMHDISRSSGEIANIIEVIDEIAFQTNLLALNAAVEAARAGESGRGFAVVASEVQQLSGRTANAAKQIKDLIHASSDTVNKGAALVDESSQAVSAIIESIGKVSQLMTDIASASHEQADGIEQVNQAIIQMDQTTQRNAAVVEQTAAASDSMSGQAKGLAQQVSFFSGDSLPGSRARMATDKPSESLHCDSANSPEHNTQSQSA